MGSTTTNPPPPPPPPPPSQLIPGLPDDISIHCLARIPKSQHPNISLVSKSWHSALLSPSLFTTRRLLGLSESFLYLNLRHHSTFFWYLLITKPNSKFSLIPIPEIPIRSTKATKFQSLEQIQRNSIKNQSLAQINAFESTKGVQIQPSSSKTGVKIQSLGQIDGFESRKGVQVQSSSTKTGVKIQSLGQIDSFLSRKGVQIQPFEQIDSCSSKTSIGIQDLGDIENALSINSVKIEPLGVIETSSLRNSVKVEALGDIENSSSRNSVKIESLGDIENSSSRNGVKTESLGGIENSSSGSSMKMRPEGGIENSSLRSSMKMQTMGMSHLLNALKSQPIGPAFAVVGSSIYLIGGSNNEIPSNGVWVFDCRFNVWEEGPRMRVGREFSAAGVVDGKIYVMGGCVVDNWTRSKNWAEVFDPVKGVWEAVPSPIEVRCKWMHASAVVGGKVYAMADRGGVVYDVRKGEWGSVTKRLDLGWRGRAAVVGGVLYCYDYLGKIRGYVVEDDRWKELRGVDKGLQRFLCGATMVNFDGKLCVVWEGKSSGKEVGIMCAVIEVKKDVDGELSGEILWSDVILTVPHSTSIVQCLVVEL